MWPARLLFDDMHKPRLQLWHQLSSTPAFSLSLSSCFAVSSSGGVIPHLQSCFSGLAANNSLSPPPVLASGGCIRAGETVSFECVAVDIVGAASTVWRGSAFNCPTSEVTTNNTITLPHGFFLSGAVGTCDSLMARGDSVEGNCYSSTLTVPATSGLDGTTVECSLGGVIDIGSSTLQIGGTSKCNFHVTKWNFSNPLVQQ